MKKNQHQQHGRDAEGGIDEARRFVEVVVDAREQDQQRATPTQRPERLLADEGVRGVIALLRHDGRGGEDHRQPDHDQQHGDEEQPLIDAGALCHCSILAIRSRAA